MEIIKNVCRLCQDHNLSVIVINSERGINLNIKNIVKQHYPTIQIGDHLLDEIICEKCWTITENFHNLFTMVEISSTKKIQYIEIKNEMVLNESEQHFQNEKVKTETNQIKDETNLLSNLSCYVNNIEQSNVLFDSANDDADDNDDQVDDDDQVIDNDDSNINNVNNIDEYDDFDNNDINKNVVKVNKKFKKSTKIKKIKKFKPEKLQILDTVKKETAALHEKQLKEFFQMFCTVCQFPFTKFSDATQHYLQTHQQSGFLSCLLCKTKFYRMCRIVEHIERHLNPDAYKCNECNKCFADKDGLRKHIANHTPFDQRKYKCDICNRSFAQFGNLSKHIRLSHCTDEQKKFNCEYCGKSFMTRSILTSHVRGVHEFAFAQICDICAKTFKSKGSFESHHRIHHGNVQQRVQCNICGSWLKNKQAHRSHITRQHGGQAICSICNVVKPNKYSLSNHMKNVHVERKYECQLCKKAFKKAISLKEHVASHTGEDLYTCSYCPKTFKSSANMHSHRKKGHPIEWQIDRDKRLFN